MHRSLLGAPPACTGGTRPGGKLYVPGVQEAKDRFAELVRIGAPALPRGDGTTAGLDLWAGALCRLLARAIAGAGRIRRDVGSGAQWWTQECRQAHITLLGTLAAHGRNTGETREARRTFEKTVKKAKRAFWETRLAGSSTNADIYAIAAWYKKMDTFAPPPLVHEGRTYIAPTEKLELLRRTVVERFGDEGDVTDPWRPLCAGQTIPWDDRVGTEEARRCAAGTGNTAPGRDNITVDLLRTA